MIVNHKIVDSIKKPKHFVIEGGTYDIYWNSLWKKHYDLSIKYDWLGCFAGAGAALVGVVVSLALLYLILGS